MILDIALVIIFTVNMILIGIVIYFLVHVRKFQKAILFEISPALDAAIKNKKTLCQIVEAFDDQSPAKVMDLLSKRIDYHGKKIENTIKGGIYIRADGRRDGGQ